MAAWSIGLGRRGALAGGLASLLLAACGNDGGKPAVPPQPRRRPGPAPDPTPEAQAFSAAVDTLGRRLAQSLHAAAPKATLLVSPFALGYGLYLLSQATHGPTRAAIEAMLSGEPRLQSPDLTKALDNLNDRMLDTADGASDYTNALWFDKSAGLRRDFARQWTDLPEARVDALDLATRADLGEINRFVANATNGAMPFALLDPLAGVSLAVVSTMYFRGAWNKVFAAADTKNAAFTRADGVVIQTPMMHAKVRLAYRETADFQAVVLPYAEPRYELILVLPKPGRELADWTQGLDVDRTVDDEVDLAIPRMSLTWGGDVLAALAPLGLAAALAPEADYGLATTTRVRPQLLFHRTLFVVDEQSAEAGGDAAPPAAVSDDDDDAAPAPKPAPAGPAKGYSFHADRPFWLALRETGDGAPLFFAFVAEPGGSMGW